MNEQITGSYQSYLIRLPNVEIFTQLFLSDKVTLKIQVNNLLPLCQVFVDSELYLVLSSPKNNRQFKLYNLQSLVNSKLVFHSEHSQGLLRNPTTFKPCDYFRITT